jgi:AcrR family transcriptional regulator
MPKIVNHDERRAEVLEATWRVISEQGLEAATVREIAAAAGVSKGVLAHYFTSKDEILIQAHRLAYDRVFVRADALTAEMESTEALRQMLYEALPLDEERRIEALIDVSYMSRALNNDALRAVRGESALAAREWWRDAITRLAADGHLADGVDVDLLVAEIQALIDGISIQAVLYPVAMTADLQKSIADAFVDRISR